MDRKQIFKLAVPSIIENILQVTLSAVDTFFVSTISSIAISAVGMNTLISNLFLTFFIAVGTGVSIITARADGANDDKRLKVAIQNGIMMLLIINLIFLIINVFLGRSILTLLGKEPNLIESGMTYFSIVIIPIVFLGLMTLFSSVLKSLGDTKSPMYVVLFINVINVILDYILIKNYGVFGAGLATTISRIVGTVILMIILEKRTKFIIGFEFKLRKGIKEMISYAIPVGLEKISMRVGQLIYGSLIIGIGIQHYTGHQIAGTIESYSYLPAMGFGVAAFSLIGHAIGEKKDEEITQIGLITYKYSTMLMVCIGIIFFIFAPNLARLFTDDQEIIRLVVVVLRIIAFFQPFLCSTQVMASSLQAIGDVKYSLYLTSFGIWIVRIFGTIVLGIYFQLGLIGVWISYALDITFRGILLYRRFIIKTYSKKRKGGLNWVMLMKKL